MIGAGLAVGFAVGLWLGIGALFSAFAAPPDETAPHWRDVVYGSGTFGVISMLARRGIASIPRGLRQAAETGRSSPIAVMFAYIFRLLGKFRSGPPPAAPDLPILMSRGQVPGLPGGPASEPVVAAWSGPRA